MPSRPRRECMVRVRASDDEAERWTAAANAANHPSLSSWVRSLADEAAATGSDGRRVATALVALRQDLARGIGNNINQLAHRTNAGGGISSDELAQATRDVRTASAAVTRALRAVRPPRMPLP